MNTWSHLEAFHTWIFGPTLKPWYSNEYLVPPSNLDTRMIIWSLLETLILEWMICTDIWWYVCKGNVGPGEMLLMQPRLRSSTKHLCYFLCHIQFRSTKYILSCKGHFSISDSMKKLTLHSFVLSCCYTCFSSYSLAPVLLLDNTLYQHNNMKYLCWQQEHNLRLSVLCLFWVGTHPQYWILSKYSKNKLKALPVNTMFTT